MEFRTYLKESAYEIEETLGSFLNKWFGEVEKVSSKLLPLVKLFAESCSGGKRVRGTLVKMGYELSGANHTPNILQPAAAFEVFQTAILSHDDIIDLSPLRRGKPTIYKALGGNHYGVSQTICLGDIGFFIAIRMISESNFSGYKKKLAVDSFVEMMTQTVLGEMLDVELPRQNGDREEDDAFKIFRHKTACYTVICPLRIGAILGNGDQKLLNNLRIFGENLGIAFQIQDDILGIFGTEGELGKSVSSDVEEGKITLLLVEAMKKATAAQKDILNQYYGNGKISRDQLERIRDVFRKTGALEYARSKAVEYAGQAKEIIPMLGTDRQKQQLLEQLADFFIERKK